MCEVCELRRQLRRRARRRLVGALVPIALGVVALVAVIVLCLAGDGPPIFVSLGAVLPSGLRLAWSPSCGSGDVPTGRVGVAPGHPAAPGEQPDRPGLKPAFPGGGGDATSMRDGVASAGSVTAGPGTSGVGSGRHVQMSHVQISGG